jgi:hypothetical protein
VALYVEAIEHMLDQARVVRQVAGPLMHGGVFIALTPNENYWWYTFLALYRGISTGHLTTDSFLTRSNSSVIVCQPCSLDYSYWTFIPKGDVLCWMSSTLGPLDRLAGSAG